MTEPSKDMNARTTSRQHPPHEGPSYLWVSLKFLVAVAFVGAGLSQLTFRDADDGHASLAASVVEIAHRRLSETAVPSYVEPLLKDLKDRRKLFTESEVIKYWFEYNGPLQVSFSHTQE